MQGETLSLFKDVASGQLAVNQLLTSTYTYLNDRLARHYGLPAPNSKTLVRTVVPAQRGGLLTQGSVLTLLSHSNETSPVLRGRWILSQLLCHDVPPPPPNVPSEPAMQPAQSRRERLTAHRIDPVCSGCHALMDPLGLALEQYDGIGAFRATDNGAAIDTSGTTPDGEPFSGVDELGRVIAASPKFSRCVSQQVFVYGLGRAQRDQNADAPFIDVMANDFAAGGQKLPALLESLVLSSVFRQRQDEPAAVPSTGGGP
jgi:hypothetical protein